MERYIETFFRFKWVFLFLLVLVPTLGVGYALDQQQKLYQAVGTVWTDKPAYLDTATTWNQYISPAQNQAGNVSEFLQSNTFALDVLKQTDLRSGLSSPLTAQATLATFRKQVSVAAVGTHLLAISYSDTDPKVAQQVVQVVITTFNAEVLSTSNSQGSVTLAFYQQKLSDAKLKVANATAALGTYLNAHPELQQVTTNQNVSQLIASANFEAQHPELVKLIQNQSTASKDEQDLQTKVDQIQFTQSSQTVGTEQSFRIMDAPALPDKPISNRKKLALQIGIALLAAVGFVVGGVVLLTILDSTIRSANEAAQRLHLPVFAAVPLMRERRELVRRRRNRRRSVRALLALQARHPELTQPTA